MGQTWIGATGWEFLHENPPPTPQIQSVRVPIRSVPP